MSDTRSVAERYGWKPGPLPERYGKPYLKWRVSRYGVQTPRLTAYRWRNEPQEREKTVWNAHGIVFVGRQYEAHFYWRKRQRGVL